MIRKHIKTPLINTVLNLALNASIADEESSTPQTWDKHFFSKAKEEGLRVYYYSGGYLRVGSVILDPETDENVYLVTEEHLESMWYRETPEGLKPSDPTKLEDFMKLYGGGWSNRNECHTVIVVEDPEISKPEDKFVTCEIDLEDYGTGA